MIDSPIPLTSVSITGTAQVGRSLTATVNPSDATATYEWKVGGVAAGTDSTYTLKSSDLGKTITVTVTGTASHSGTVTSNQTVPVKCSFGSNIIATLDSDGVLTISGTGDMTNFTSTTSPVYNNTNIKSVVINAGVSSVGQLAFESCTGLTTVSLGSVTSIGDGAFNSCSNLVALKLSTTVPAVGTDVFTDCPATRSLAFVDADGADLAGTALTTAQSSYASFDDGGVGDNSWYGWTIKPKADLTAYNAALASVSESDYTEDSWTTYKAVVNANVVSVENTQTEVNTATANITAAQGSLVTKAKSNLGYCKGKSRHLNGKQLHKRSVEST